ncbi:MAG: hypothetical protein ACKOKF_09375 [Bacteroidota bacterium]
MHVKRYTPSWIILLLAVFLGCEQSDPPSLDPETGDFYFSGYYWNIKASGTSMMGPGPNFFGGTSENVWLDQDSMLHLRITKRNNRWYCGEVISAKEFGYGTYIFTVDGRLDTMNERAVFGLFTWNDYSFQEQANSEVDVEFARWGNANDSQLLTYSVQPVWFDNPAPFLERTRRPGIPVTSLRTPTTHVFKWTPDTVFWYSCAGESFPGNQLLASWKYDKSNIPRAKIEGGRVSNPIIIPAPFNTTNVRFNLWLLSGIGPASNRETEVVIKRFEFRPL